MKMKKTETFTFDFIDFQAFSKEKQRDPFYNERRLRVKRKLGQIGKELQKELPKEHSLVHRTSLSHPYLTNQYQVRSLWLYFSRSPNEKKKLKEILGVDIGKDSDSHYIQTLLVLEVSEKGLALGLKIHSQAWWDGENLKRKCSHVQHLQTFVELLNSLKGFALTNHNWKREYLSGEITQASLQNFFHYYTPGEHWLQITQKYTAQEVLEGKFKIYEWVKKGFFQLLPLYQFIIWKEENNFVFS
ncbi:MAG: hypothetical protein D6785_15270 [Planctomycetota bacterium]|nr:MAG: hypothetical protein D6785_15270 [Planctomycetota bacterium]